MRTTSDECRHKQLVVANQNQNKAFIELLNKRALNTAQASNLPLYVIDSSQQQGSSFAERFHHAIQSVFDRGYDRVICLGNDIPELQTTDLAEVNQRLNEHDIVIGAGNKGGIYTLGIRKKAFQTLDFDQLPWQTAELVAGFCALTSRYKVGKLEAIYHELNDALDRSNFIQYVKHHQKKLAHLSCLVRFFTATRSHSNIHLTPLFAKHIFVLILRGPPNNLDIAA